MRYHLILHDELRTQITALNAACKRDPRSDEAKEYVAVMKALRALQDGRETEYEGKQLGFGLQSYDLRDFAQIKIEVFDEYRGHKRLGASHRLTYQEFDPLPPAEGSRAVEEPNALPYRYVVAFVHRAADPAAVTGRRVGRARGYPLAELRGVTGARRPSVGPPGKDEQITPERVPVPSDLLRLARILRDGPPAGTGPQSAGAPEATINRPDGSGAGRGSERQ
ncbi:hypothetical protein [Kribbella solani]|uniref:Uncharacterized protein n=1 Tax=Kribbella solani TaxID=236067 RepID=A0A841DMV1_9ACTN|nr:hypothetical protein [Kribbella solani]MBB5979221.1 hypothetical protein [Kribbella solani]